MAAKPRLWCTHCQIYFTATIYDRCPGCLTRYRIGPHGSPKPAGKGSKRVAWRKLLTNRDGRTCRRCGTDKSLTIDHILPVSKGGNGSWTTSSSSARRATRPRET